MNVRADAEDSVVTVTLDRPEKRNALSIGLRRELAETFRRLADDDGTAVVVLTGAGSAFCAGMDTKEFGGDAAHKRELFDSSVDLFDVLGAFGHPLIGAINGPALGGGCALAAMCDVRISSPDATFGHPEVSFGVPASYAALLRMASDQVARELALTGRVIGADEALALGIVREVHPEPVARARELANEMARHGARVLAQTKRMMLAAERGSVARAWAEERDQFHRALFGG